MMVFLKMMITMEIVVDIERSCLLELHMFFQLGLPCVGAGIRSLLIGRSEMCMEGSLLLQATLALLPHASRLYAARVLFRCGSRLYVAGTLLPLRLKEMFEVIPTEMCGMKRRRNRMCSRRTQQRAWWLDGTERTIKGAQKDIWK
jgi:hypothetical protein